MATQPVIEIGVEQLHPLTSTFLHPENPPEILGGLEIELTAKEVQGILNHWFKKEKREYKLGRFYVPGFFFGMKLDSQNPDTTNLVYQARIRPKLELFGYSEIDIEYIQSYLRDLYANARVFGSFAGPDDAYQIRNRTPPTLEELSINLKKEINAEVLATDRFVLGKVTDTGNGVDIKAYQEKMRRSDEELARMEELPIEEKLRVLERHLAGKGLRLIEGDTKNPLLFGKKPASTTFLKYAA